jgi:hypothetical protein
MFLLIYFSIRLYFDIGCNFNPESKNNSILIDSIKKKNEYLQRQNDSLRKTISHDTIVIERNYYKM